MGINGEDGGNRIMRALIAFDLSSIPPGSTIENVTLLMDQSLPRDDFTGRDASLHRVMKDWGEGSSDAERGEAGGAQATEGDATWLHTFYNDTLWANPGGDFEASASATVSVRGNGFYQWFSTEALVADVQAWVDDPSSNSGWLIKGQESLNGAIYTARRFTSRHATVINTRPNLTVKFTPADQVSRPEIVFPQYVAGGGDSTRGILRNNSATPSTGSISFVDENGDPAQVSIGGVQMDTVPFSLEPWGSVDISTDTTGELTAGAVEVIDGLNAALIGLIQKKPGGDLIAIEATNNPFPGDSQQ